MFGSGYYPAGAEFDPNAPYNELPERTASWDVLLRLFGEDGRCSDVTVRVVTGADDYRWMTLSDFEDQLIQAADRQLCLRDYDDCEIVDYKEVG